MSNESAMGQDDQQGAAEALAAIHGHQERARRAARLPWWVYAAMFVLAAGGSAANDFIDLTGAKLLSAVVLVLFVVVFVVVQVSRSAPLSSIRGVQRRQSFVPSTFAVVAIVGGLGGWLISHYGTGFAHSAADAVGLHHYPNTVAGIVYAAAFTALFALGQLLITTSQRRTSR